MHVNLKYNERTIPITNSTRSAFGKRGITGGVLVKFEEIPESVLEELLAGAVADYLQAGLKTLDKENATQKDCQDAMKKRLEVLKTGATSSPAGKRKAPTRDPVKAAAKMIVKKSIIDSSDEKLDSKTLTTMVSQLFKAYDADVKRRKGTDEEPEGVNVLIANALVEARRQQDEQEKMSESLVEVVKKAKAASAAAAKAKAAAAAEAGEEEVAKPKPAASKPKPKRTPAPSAAGTGGPAR